VSWKSEITGIWLDKQEVAIRPQAAEPAGVNTIFTITGGPVWIQSLFGWTPTGIAGAVTATFTINGIPVDVGATLITSVANDLVLCPLDDSATNAITVAAAGNQPTLADVLLGAVKFISPPGLIVCTIAVGTGVGETIGWYCVYYRMSPNSLIQ
jgi:uncharacterized membrane protein